MEIYRTGQRLNSLNYANKTSFRGRLLMRSQEDIAKSLGEYAAREAESARNILSELAKNHPVDISVIPRPDNNIFPLDAFEIRINHEQPIKDGFIKMFDSCRSEHGWVHTHSWYETDGLISSRIIEKANELVNKFLQYS